jgi:cytochrome c
MSDENGGGAPEESNFNTIAGWVLFSAVVAFGLSSLSTHYFEADKNHRPHKMGYEIEGVVSSEGGGNKEEPIEALLAKADPAKGQATFAKCTSCHTIDAGGANGIGPNLHGIVGDHIAEGRGGFAFSDALKSHGGAWDWKNLSDWLKSPKAFAPGTKMTFAGLGNGQDRANLIAWLNTQGSNLPLPAAPAAAAGGEGAAAPNAANATNASAAGAVAGKEAAGAAAPNAANQTNAAAAGAAAQPAPGTGPAPAQDKSTVAPH